MSEQLKKEFEQLNIRLEVGLREKLKEIAKENKRSLNGHVEYILEKSISADDNEVIRYLLKRIDQLESELSALKS